MEEQGETKGVGRERRERYEVGDHIIVVDGGWRCDGLIPSPRIPTDCV
jgi:hypothetical protein